MKKRKRKKKNIDEQFSNTELFEEPKTFKPNVNILSAKIDDIILPNDIIRIHFYPDGGRDNSVILLNTEDEIASLKIHPFLDKTHYEFHEITSSIDTEEDFRNLQDNIFKKIEK